MSVCPMPGDPVSDAPSRPHDWLSIHQQDFPPEIYWIQMCGICFTIDGAALGRQLDNVRTATQKAEDRAEAATEYARRLHAWANELVAL